EVHEAVAVAVHVVLEEAHPDVSDVHLTDVADRRRHLDVRVDRLQRRRAVAAQDGYRGDAEVRGQAGERELRERVARHQGGGRGVGLVCRQVDDGGSGGEVRVVQDPGRGRS